MANQLKNKYIFTATVVDNKDPLMLNRVRVSFDSQLSNINNQSILDAINNVIDGRKTKTEDNKDLLPEFKWTKIDSFCFLPLLPVFIKTTPKIGESVNILWPNPDIKFNEQYYIQGVFSSVLTIFNENSASQRMFATKDRIIDAKLLKNPSTDAYYKETTKGVFIEPEDIGLVGRGTCDIVLKNNDVLIRAGKSDKSPDSSAKEIKVKTSRSFLQLSDFSNRIDDNGYVEAKRLEENVQYVPSLVEWQILNPENQFNNFTLIIYLYSLIQKKEYTTKTLQIDTNVNQSDKSLTLKQQFSGLKSSEVVDTVNKFIGQFNDGQINMPLHPIVNLSSTNRFPVIFRPDSFTYKWISKGSSSGTVEYTNIIDIKNKIFFKSQKNGFGLIFSQNKAGQQPNVRKEKLKDFKFSTVPTTYTIIGADKFVLLSHESQIPSKSPITLDASTVYGISQTFLADKVMPNTDPMVRGDELMKFLNLVVRFLVSHVHPVDGTPPDSVSLDGASAQDILNKSQSYQNVITNENLRIN